MISWEKQLKWFPVSFQTAGLNLVNRMHKSAAVRSHIQFFFPFARYLRKSQISSCTYIESIIYNMQSLQSVVSRSLQITAGTCRFNMAVAVDRSSLNQFWRTQQVNKVPSCVTEYTIKRFQVQTSLSQQVLTFILTFNASRAAVTT